MKITDIKVSQVESHRFMLVRIFTDEGITGIGEGSGLTGSREWIPRFRRLLVGDDPFDVDRIVTQLLWGQQRGEFITYGEEDEQNPVEAWLHRYGASGASLCQAATRAVSAIEMALLDLKGKALGVPVYQLLGGKYRNRIRIYADLAGTKSDDPAEWKEIGIEARESGFTAVKFDLDYAFPHLHEDPWNRSLSNREVDRAVSVVAAVREGLGDEVDLALDCHGQYNLTDAIRLGRALEPFQLLWLEDPLPDFHPEKFRQLRDAVPVPIAVGELFQTIFEARSFIDQAAMDILHLDPRMCGGLTEYRRINDYADAHYIPSACHNGASPFGTLAMAHANAAVRCFLCQEYHWSGLSWVEDLIEGEGFTIREGYLEVPNRPGFGIEIREKAWKERAVEGP